jgi:hypothetical protein
MQSKLSSDCLDDSYDRLLSMIRGCSCFRSWTVNDQYGLNYFPMGSLPQSIYNNYNRSKFYRGPYAYAATDWIGSDCSLAACPTGLDPTLTSSRIGHQLSLYLLVSS